MDKFIVINRPSGLVTIVRSKIDSPTEPPLSEHEQIINELFQEIKRMKINASKDSE